MIKFNKYSPLSLFFPFGVVPVCGILGLISGYFQGKEQTKAGQIAADAQLEGAELINQRSREIEERLLPYSQGGVKAFEQQQAYSGALGPEAQQAAYDQYVESPGVQFLRDRGMRGIERNAAARGGNDLFGGNVEKAKIDYSQGLATQDFNNFWNRLGSVTGTGLAATQAIGGVGSQAAQGQAQLTAGAGQSMADARVARAGTYASAFNDMTSGLTKMIGFGG